MRHISLFIFLAANLLFFQTTLVSCKKPTVENPQDTIVPPPPKPFDINSISDDYSAISSADKVFQWASHNVHDPCAIKDGAYFYCYNTDVAYGATIKPGIQIRRSKDLIDWQFYGWAFADIPKQAADYVQQHGGTPNKGLWAPYVLKVGNEFRLYYSLASTPLPRLSTIGLATAPTAVGPWTEKGLVVSSTDDFSTQTNAIDPSVLVTQNGEHWMFYGSAWDGIYILKLNPTTGLAETGGSRGRRISQRGFTAGKPNGNIEGAEIIYNPTLGKYFLFIAYDWLQTKYNVRVGRADSPEGPFLDFNGEDLNLEKDHAPMILAPYQFAGHGGFQGVSHCGIVEDGGQFYMLHQARPAVNSFFMNLHVRKILWTPEGWPVVSPERFAATDQTTPINMTEISGNWERIELGYRVVPGYQNEQLSPDLQVAEPFVLNVDGTFNGGSWTFSAPILEIKWASGSTEKLIVERGRDWENKKNCLVFTGLNDIGTAVWGKK